MVSVRSSGRKELRSPGGRTLVFGILVGLVIGLLLALFRPQLPASGAPISSSVLPGGAQAERAFSTGSGGGGSGSSGSSSGGSGSGGGGWQRRPTAPAGLPMEVYARAPSKDADATAKVAALLSDQEKKQLRQLCGRTLYHSLQTGWVSHEAGAWTFVATGDLPLMWIRDSAVQIGVLLPRIAKRPALRGVIEGAIRAQAFFITQDPYANGYEPEWRHPDERNDGDRTLGRGGWVGVRNYELDSGAYYLNLLWNWYLTPGLYRPEVLLEDPRIFGAANLLVDVWIAEQRHNASSPYRYTELSNGWLGPEVEFTGMTWSGFRPSDDPSQYGFPVPANMYAAAGLERALELNRRIWRDEAFDGKASRLLSDIKLGIESHGRVKAPGPGDTTIYAYEVDGKGNSLTDFDDPNIPSLVSIPMLGYSGFDRQVYQNTRKRLMDPATNKFYFKGSQFKGMGSPHTSQNMAWALGIYTEVLTATTPEEKAEGLKTLLKLQCGDGLMHESVNVNDLKQCTRKWFEWANALLVVSVEQLLGYDCDASAQAFHLGYVQAREQGRAPDVKLFQTAESAMQWDGIYKSKVADWKGIGNLVPLEEDPLNPGGIKPVEDEAVAGAA